MEVKALRDNVHLLGLSSIEDVEQALEKAGYQEDHFDFVVTDTSSPTVGLYHIYSTVQTTHKANRKTRTYNAGQNSSWAFEFETDLKSGFYN